MEGEKRMRTALAILATCTLALVIFGIGLDLWEHKSDLAFTRAVTAVWIGNYLLILFRPIQPSTHPARS